MFGGTGDDIVYGGVDNDIVDAGDGNDSAFGGFGNDLVYGGAGNDTITGSGDTDTVYGGTGDDYVQGSDGADMLYGAGGADTLLGEEDADTIHGGGGDYVDGYESVTTGTDADTLYVVDVASVTFDVLNPEDGTVLFNDGSTLAFYNIGAGDGAADLAVLGDGFGADTITGFEGAADNGDGSFTGNDLLDVQGYRV